MFKFTRTTIVLIAIVQLIPGCSSITPSASRVPQYPIAIKPQFDYASDFHEGLAAIRAGDKWGYIDKQGGIAIKPKFDEVGDFSHGLARVRMGTKWGYIDKQATTISTPRFDEAFDFSDGFARVRTGSKWGYVGVNGALLIERKYQDAGDFHEGLAAVKVENAWGYINKDGTLVINPVLYEANRFSDGLALVRLKNGWGPKAYIAKNGNIEIDLKNLDGHAFHEGLARMGGASYINAQGKEVIYAGYLKPGFFLGGDFHEGVARVSVRLPIGVRDGFIDQQGNYVINPAFDEAGDFSEGFAAIKKDGKWGYIDKQGSIIIDPQFDYASDFHDGLARVEVGFKWGFIKAPALNPLNSQQVARKLNQLAYAEADGSQLNCTIKVFQGGHEILPVQDGKTNVYKLVAAPFKLQVSPVECKPTMSLVTAHHLAYIQQAPLVFAPFGLFMAGDSSQADILGDIRGDNPRTTLEEILSFTRERTWAKQQYDELCSNLGYCPTPTLAISTAWPFIDGETKQFREYAEFRRFNKFQDMSGASGRLLLSVVYTRWKEMRKSISAFYVLKPNALAFDFR